MPSLVNAGTGRRRGYGPRLGGPAVLSEIGHRRYRGDMIIAADLADLSWVRVGPPTLGELSVPACSGEFLAWVRTGLKAARWPDGSSLARDLLATQARPQRDAEPLGEGA